jgi:hypothetical protein
MMMSIFPGLVRFFFCTLYCSLLLSCSEKELPTPPGPFVPDTTSHAVSWTIYDTLGDQHSYLLDVFALNDTCVYAVGKLTDYQDTLSKPIRYNVARWDGRQWHRMSIHTTTFDGDAVISIVRAVFAFAPDDVWIASESGGYAHWNGKEWKRGYINKRRGTVYRIFGFSPDDIYFVCSMGGITHYTRRYSADVWEFIESGTEKDINDVWGVNDTILALACNVYGQDASTEIIRIVEGTVSRFPKTKLDNNLRTIWFSPTGKKVVGGAWYQEWQGDKWWGFVLPSKWFLMSMRGNHDYDVWAVGHGSTVDHFNGSSWKLYNELSFNEKYKFYSVACIPGQVWVVGDDNIGRSVIVHGRS